MTDQPDQTADLSEFIDNGKETEIEPQELPVRPHIVSVRSSRTSPRPSFDAADVASLNSSAPSLLRTKSQSQLKSGEDSLFKTIPQLIELEDTIDDVDKLGTAAVMQSRDIDVTKLLLALSAVRRVEMRLVEETRAVSKSTSDLKQQQSQVAALDADLRRRAEQLDQQTRDLEDRARDLETGSERLKSEEKRIEELRQELQRKELEIKSRDEQLHVSESDMERRVKEVEELESRAQEQRESVREQSDELTFKVRQFEQTHKMFELQQEHFKVQSQQLNERETVLAQRHEFIHQQEEALKRRESAVVERERELDDAQRTLRERETALTKQSVALESQPQHVISAPITDEHSSHVDSAVLRELEAKLSAVEQEFYRASDELHRSEEMNDILQNRQVALENELDFLKQEIESKNEQFAKLGHQLKEIRRSTGYTEDTSTAGTSGTKPPSSKEQIRRLVEELENARVANQAHQTQNSFLSQTLQRLLQEKTTESKAKKKTFEYYQRELDQLRTESQLLRRRLLLHEVSGVKEEFLAEIEDMKREFFFTLTVGIKLNRTLQGQPCNLDAHALWDRAKQIHYRKWNDWLNAQFIDDQSASTAQSNANNNKTATKQSANNSTAKDGNAVSMTTFNRAAQRNS